MHDVPDYLERLTRLSPVDEQTTSLEADGVRRAPWLTIREKIVVFGLALIIVSGLLLFWMYGLASLTDTDPNDPRYWPEVLSKMFEIRYGGTVAIPASLGLGLGIALLSCGIFKTSRPGKHQASSVQ
jgi:hypothetical protein